MPVSMTLCTIGTVPDRWRKKPSLPCRNYPGKNDTLPLTVVASNLKPLRKITLISLPCGNVARVSFAGMPAGKPSQQQIVLPHYPVYAPVVDRRAASSKQLSIKKPLDTPITLRLATAPKIDNLRQSSTRIFQRKS